MPKGNWRKPRQATIRGHRLYKTWRSMLDRCYNPNTPNFKNYGGRGVTVSDRWRNDYDAFYKWAMSSGGWKQGLQLDKDKRSGGIVGDFYCPECCCFITGKENMRLRSVTKRLEHDGKVMCASEWNEHMGLPPTTISSRMQHGWSLERAINTPLQPVFRMLDHNGESLHVGEWSRRIGIGVQTILKRLKRGWSIERTLSEPVAKCKAV